MFSIRKILKPAYILSLICIVQFSFYFLYQLGIIKSFRINYISYNLLGFFGLLIFYLVPIFVSKVGERVKHKPNVQLVCCNERRLETIVIVYLLIALSGFLKLTVDIIGNYGFSAMGLMLLTNRQIDLLKTGDGNTILVNFGLASLLILATFIDLKKFKHKILIILNLVLLFVYASFLSSRILIVQAVFYVGLILFRRFKYNFKFSVKRVILPVAIMGFLLVLTSGYRDYNEMGNQYTESKLEWGYTRITDYLISTTNLALEYPEFVQRESSTFPAATFQMLNDYVVKNSAKDDSLFRRNIAAAEYTNIGAFSQFYSDYRELYFIVLIFVGALYSIAWRAYERGSLAGLLIYPIFFYNIMESWRIYYLGTSMAEMLLIIAVFSYFLCKRSFVSEIVSY